MKQTFLYKTFDWVLIVISLISSILTFLKLINGFEYFSTFLLKIAFTFVSLTALISLLVQKINGERFSRIFLIVMFIIPAIFVLYEYLTDLIFYGINRLNLLQNPFLYVKLIVGVILFYLTIKFSKQKKTQRIKDYGILISGIGIFVICYVLIRKIEPNFNSELMNYSNWKAIIKSIIGILVFFVGIRIKNQKIKLNKGIILTSITMFIFGLI